MMQRQHWIPQAEGIGGSGLQSTPPRPELQAPDAAVLLLTDGTWTGGSHEPFSWGTINLPELTELNLLLASKRTELKNSPMEEMLRARHGEGAGSFQALSTSPALTAPPRVCQSGRALNPILLGFYAGYRTEARLMKSLATGDCFNLWLPSPPLPCNPLNTGWLHGQQP